MKQNTFCLAILIQSPVDFAEICHEKWEIMIFSVFGQSIKVQAKQLICLTGATILIAD